MSKRRLIFLVSLSLTCFGLDAVFAAQTADVTVTVTVRKLSVSVSSGTLAFGAVNEASQTVAGAAITVTNDGNVTEDFQLKLTNPAGWTATQSGTPGVDEYKLGAIYRSGAPVAGDFSDSQDFISTGYVTPTASIFAKDADAAGVKGYSVATSGTRDLWFLFHAPSETTIGSQQLITATIKAVAT